jgi:arabinofuranan 3-O-arabinosyltransferase
LLVTLSLRHVSGALPHLCLWETGPERCAHLPVIADTEGWTAFASTAIPDAGTTDLGFYLYADVYEPGSLTENDYADVRVLELPSLPQFDFVGTPATAAGSASLVIQHSGYSPNWRGPAGSRPVLVDGLLNGWYLSPGQPFSSRYLPSDEVLIAFWVSGLGLLATLGFTLSLIPWRKLVILLRAGTYLSK